MSITPLLILMILLQCSSSKKQIKQANILYPTALNCIDNPYNSVGDIPLPAGHVRKIIIPNTFTDFLKKIKLKKNKTVFLFNRELKKNQTAQFAVLDIPIGDKDLQQCADAVIRLRASFLFNQKRYNEILFIDNNGKSFPFRPPYTIGNFDKYLFQVFGNCGSASLAKQLQSKKLNDIKPGDVFIRGGFPGHAVIVMDVASNKNGETIFLLAQSYMPAQDIHFLKNPINQNLSPWYSISSSDKIITPEYIFYQNELKKW
jgi:hypothetical protein